MGTVMIIPAKKQVGSSIAKEEVKKLRVAAYCRVSTDMDTQQGSYESQIKHYTDYINGNPEWENAGIFADEGISAVTTKKRTEFNRMIQACMEDRIDMIITKSISRFARNTVDCLNYIRKLKEKKIAVFFEKENINTLDAKGETLLIIMASLAQQESESLSLNTRMGYQYRFQQGKIIVNAKMFLGYDKDENGNLVINPEQAEIVKRIFREYLEGASCQKIAKGLERDGISTVRGNTKWHSSSIRRILENEKYMGDALLQKTYTVDFLQKKRDRNHGELPQYYVEDSHEAIIPKEIFLMVQKEIARRGQDTDCMGRKRCFSANHCFTHLIYCAECGELFRRLHWKNRGKQSIVWRCISRLNKKDSCSARTLNEESLKSAFVEAFNNIIADSQEYSVVLAENIASVLTETEITSEDIDSRLEKLQQELLERAGRHESYNDLAEEIFCLREEKEKALTDETARKQYLERMTGLKEFIENQPDSITEFDETLVKHLLAKVTVSEDSLLFEFKSGLTVSRK